MTKTTLSFFILIIVLLVSCTETTTKESKLKKEQLIGKTMGTTFSISFLDSMENDPSTEVENLLIAINKSVSTYQNDSEISIFNQGDSLLVDSDGHFARNFLIAKEIYTKSNGWFNPTVMPLVNYWGFGYTAQKMVNQADSVSIRELLTFVQFDSIRVEESDSQLLFIKQKKGIQLDFSAIAKGDAVDQVGLLLESKGIDNYFIEIGGEVRARGEAVEGFDWRVGIRVPKENTVANDFQITIELSDLSLATSGNYENYHEDKTTGAKYAHTINPHTGYPEKNSLLSASIFAENCATADAFATASMAMGLEKAFSLASELPEIEAHFIYSDQNGNLKEKSTPKATELMKK
jgi:thiamine biosynthesis lipoprotein